MSNQQNHADLIPVTQSTINKFKTLTVDGRELHAFLGVGRDFSTWIKDRINEYGFIDGTDFVVFTKSGENPNLDSPRSGIQKGRGGRPTTTYTLTIDMAKELSMVEKNEKGRQVRHYFIECEYRAREVAQTLPAPEAKPIDPPKLKRGPKPKAPPAQDPVQAQIDDLISGVRFHRREIASKEKQISDILIADRHQNRPTRFEPGQDTADRVYLDLACAHRGLWTTIDFSLQAVESSIQAIRAAARM